MNSILKKSKLFIIKMKDTNRPELVTFAPYNPVGGRQDTETFTGIKPVQPFSQFWVLFVYFFFFLSLLNLSDGRVKYFSPPK